MSVSLDPTGHFLDNPSAVITRGGKLDTSFGGR